MKLLSLFFLSLTIILNAEKKSIEIPSIFSDNMVLQQNTSVTFWGKSESNTNINISGSWGESATSVANEDGRWEVKINTPKAGGPYEVRLQIRDSVINYKNVMIGEVWLCSGQSNMEMTLTGWPPNDLIENSEETIKNSANPELRFFTVARAFSHMEEFNLKGTWEESNPETAARFSATAYFFGKKLNEELNVPVGLINSSWGGTPVESWISGTYIDDIDQFKSIVEDIEQSAAEFDKYSEWLLAHPVINLFENISKGRRESLSFNDDNFSSVDYSDAEWKEMELPRLWETTSDLSGFDGVVWFRKKIEIPETWLNKNLVLELGPIDDMDRTFVNGELAGAIEELGFYNKDRVYIIPTEAVKDKNLLIAIRVTDSQGGGGIFGKEDQLKIHPADSDESVSLSGSWKFMPVAEFRDGKFYIFNNDFYSRPKIKIALNAYTPTTLFNGMIHPLIPFAIRGAIWYQGEANVGDPDLYSELFPLMIKNWRDEWNDEFPFYYVQIAPYDYGKNTFSERLRESQLKALSVPNTGMAVTLDIGNPKNIHPRNKKDVGERLARWALAKTYEKDIIFSGPLYKSFITEGDKIILSFDYADDGLVIKELNGENNFMIAGEDKIFKKAEVKIDGNKLIVSNPEVKNPAAVRYAWSNIAEGTLFNKEGLPASSFRTDNWEK